MDSPKLEDKFNIAINAFSYPFGEQKDCLSSEALRRQTQEYQLAFTVEEMMNTHDTSPFELGRYMPMSTDTDIILRRLNSAKTAPPRGQLRL